MPNRDDWGRGEYGRDGEYRDDWRPEARDRDEERGDWRDGGRFMRGSDRGWDRGPEGRGPGEARWREERERGYNLGMNYGQGGDAGQGFGPSSGYSRFDERRRPQEYGGPGSSGRSGSGYGGLGGQGYRASEGSWRQGRVDRDDRERYDRDWSGGYQGPRDPYDPRLQGDRGWQSAADERRENLQTGFGMSPYGSYRAHDQGSYGSGWSSGGGYSGSGGYAGGSGYGGVYGSTGYGASGQGTGYGSGQTGYGQGQRQPRPPRGYQRSDERIREDLCDALVRHQIDAGDVDVRVERGEVTFSGSVDSKQDKRRIEDIAESITGVRDVHNQVRVSGGEDRIGQSSASSGSNVGTGSASGQIGQNAGRNAGSSQAGTNRTS